MEILNTISQNIYDSNPYTLFSLYILVLGILGANQERIVRFFHITKNALLFAVWVIIMLMGLDKLGVYELQLHTIYFIFILSILLSLPFLYIKIPGKLFELLKKLITNPIVRALFWLALIFMMLSNYIFKIAFIEKYYFFIFYTLVPLIFLSDVFTPPIKDDEENEDKTISELLFPWIKRHPNPKE